MNDQHSPTIVAAHRSARFFNYLHRYKSSLRKRWWLLPLGLAAGLGVQGYRIWSTPPSYSSVGRMIVAIKINAQIGAGYMEELTQFLGTQAALMKSARVLEKAYDRVKALKPNLPAVPVDLQIAVSPKTTIFNLKTTGSEPEYTRAYLDACMEEYILLKKDMRVSTSDTTLANITEQITSLERDLKKYEDEELSFKTTNNVTLIQEQGNYAAKYLVQLNGQLALLKTEGQLLTLLNLDQNLDRQQRKAPVASTGSEPATENEPLNLLNSDYFKARQDLQLKKAEFQEWSEYLKPKHPRMVALSEDITRRERLLEIFKEQSQEQLESRRKSIALQIENLEKEIKEWEIKSLDVSKRKADHERILANKQRIQNLYDRLLGTMQSIGVDTRISPESVTVLERATRPFPAGPNPSTTLVIGAIVGMLAALGIVMLVERLDDRPSSFTDLQELFDEPVLGQIPLEFGLNRSRNGVPVLQPDDKRHVFLEAYRSLRSSLLYMSSEGKRPRVLLVTSAVPSDGKSMTAANLAITMALSGSRVVLVDADMRKGMMHQHFQVEATPGLNEVLSQSTDWRQAVRPTATPNLSVLPRGNTSRNPGEMFLSESTLVLIKELAAAFDYVIFDSAPVMAADDVTSLAPHMEGVAFVVRANYTKARVARAALDLLYQREVNVLGLVFNSVDTSADEYYYYQYKGYYYSDHKKPASQ